MDNNIIYNSRKYYAHMIFTIFVLISILYFVLLIYGGVIYNILINSNSNSIMTKYFMLYCIIQFVCSFITGYYILIGIYKCCKICNQNCNNYNCCYYCNNHNSSLKSLYCTPPLIIIAIIIIITYLINCTFIGLISYNFFAYETVSDDYFILMLIFVILSLIVYSIPLLYMAIVLILFIFIRWPLTIYTSYRSRNRNDNYYR